MKEGFVYIVSTEKYASENVYKIGCTKNIERRLSEFNSTRIKSDFFQIYFLCKTFNYFYFENLIHNYFKDFKVNNEFFLLKNINLNIEQIKNILITNKSKFTYHLEISYDYMKKNKIIWNKNFFTENNIISYNENVFLDNLKIYILNQEKYKLSKYMSNDHWNKILQQSKLFDYSQKVYTDNYYSIINSFNNLKI